ncbi:hypothetical protein C0991_000579 [Blastosporella zonata]|nr:hypothetical protein C0991_000579 [Blastosporella zonata]
MIWLSGLGGIQPVGSAVTTGISLAGQTWTLWKGPNSNWEVFSFVVTSQVNSFSADLNVFFRTWLVHFQPLLNLTFGLVEYLIANQGVAGSQYVQAIQAGTEPFTGSANLVTSSYSVAIN